MKKSNMTRLFITLSCMTILLSALGGCVSAPVSEEEIMTKENHAVEEKVLRLNGTELRGTLLIPGGAGPDSDIPAALIIAGSGPTDRDGNSSVTGGKNNSLKMLAEELTLRGIATLRYDKRGTGESSGGPEEEASVIFSDFISDAAAWIELLQSDSRLGGITLIGHSEGALIGMAASGELGVNGYVSIAGQGRPIDQVLEEQLAAQPDFVIRESEKILASLRKGKSVEEVPDYLAPLFRPSVQPFLMDMMQYDPGKMIRDMPVPALLVQGGRDLQIGMTDFTILKEAQPEAETLLFPEMNHVLKMVKENQQDNLAAYTDPSRPLAPGLAEGIAAFITGGKE